MQSTIFVITLVLMAVVGWLFWRAVSAVNGKPAGTNINKRRTQLIWGMVIAGVLISVGSMREWPYAGASEKPVVVNVVGGQWWWEIDKESLPLHTEIEFRVTSEDVNHGMGIFNEDLQLLAQVQGMPGYVNKLYYTFDKPGTYQVLCLEFCGVAHHDMINEFEVVAAE